MFRILHRLVSKKPPPWRVTGASVARHVERPWVRSKNVYIAEPAPELQPICCEIGKPPIPVACQPSVGKGAVRGLLLTRLADPFPARNEINGELLKRAKLSPCVGLGNGTSSYFGFVPPRS